MAKTKKKNKKNNTKNKKNKYLKRLRKIKNKLLSKKEMFSLFEMLIIVIISILFGVIVGNFISYKKDNKITTKVSTELEEMIETYDNIVDNYYDKVNKDELINAGIKGMVNYLEDPYSMYMDEESTEVFNEEVDGEYSGIGATVSTKDGKYVIVDMFKKSPAEKAGLKVDDQFIAINGNNIEAKSLSKVTELIKGKKGTTLKIKVKRGDEEIEFKVTRNTIQIPSVSTQIIEKNDKKVGVITIDTFAANTYKQFNSKLKTLEKKKIDSLVIDVRNNLGGHLSQVSEIVSLFLPKDKIMYQIEEKGKKTKVYSYNDSKKKYKVVVLINKASASASEILAAAFKESYSNALIVGNNSYGKGTVQKAYELSTGASIKYTTEKWLTPKGNWINEKGIMPDISVDLSDEYKSNPSIDTDNQLQTAIEEATK